MQPVHCCMSAGGLAHVGVGDHVGGREAAVVPAEQVWIRARAASCATRAGLGVHLERLTI
jgi:hypothetical protein